MSAFTTSPTRAFEPAGIDAELPLVVASSATPRRVNWLWPGRIALGKVTLLAGDPGQGKSLLTLDMAARVSTGAAWPDEGIGDRTEGGQDATLVRGSDAVLDFGTRREAGSVIVLCEEDDLDDTIRPRLDVHGADCDRVLIAAASARRPEGNECARGIDLSRDLPRLERMLEKLPDCRLVVIDPIAAYLGRCIENTNSEVRGVLGPLTAIAARRNVAVVAVTHLRKKEGAALYRSLGSLAFVAASRAAWLTCSDPEDSERHFFLPLKNNVSGERRGLAYRVESRGPLDTGYVHWEEHEITVSAEKAVGRAPRMPGRPDIERVEAAAWLEEFLANGPQLAGLVREAADAHGFPYGTIRRVFRQLEGESMRQESGNQSCWLWKLPAIVERAREDQRQAG